MPVAMLTAEEIAEQHLLMALRLWQEDALIPCITLAGAAEEILGKRLRALGREPTYDNLKRTIIQISTRFSGSDQHLEGIVGTLLNQTKNDLKHYSDEHPIAIDLREYAEEILERATSNYVLLTNNILPEIVSFWSSIEEQSHTS